ncbi:MAG: glycosyltransferase family 2 protein [Kiritimatiellaeota bacterium]|nr:glycosyltransferase family 2 protein [Kiritimatiellota bacterium]
MSLLVLIPCYRESAHIGAVVREVAALGHSAVVIDDGSDDGTAAAARAAGAEVIVHERNQGKGAAIATGIRRALADPDCAAVVLMDGDGQHLPAEITRFTEEFGRSGAVAIVGSRMADTRAMPLVRRLTNRFMSALLSWQMGRRVTDTQCGFRLLARPVFPLALECASGGFSAESEILCQLALRGHEIREVPVSTIYGDEKSKIRPVRDTVRFFKMFLHFRAQRRKISRDTREGGK